MSQDPLHSKSSEQIVPIKEDEAVPSRAKAQSIYTRIEELEQLTNVLLRSQTQMAEAIKNLSTSLEPLRALQNLPDALSKRIEDISENNKQMMVQFLEKRATQEPQRENKGIGEWKDIISKGVDAITGKAAVSGTDAELASMVKESTLLDFRRYLAWSRKEYSTMIGAPEHVQFTHP